MGIIQTTEIASKDEIFKLPKVFRHTVASIALSAIVAACSSETTTNSLSETRDSQGSHTNSTKNNEFALEEWRAKLLPVPYVIQDTDPLLKKAIQNDSESRDSRESKHHTLDTAQNEEILLSHLQSSAFYAQKILKISDYISTLITENQISLSDIEPCELTEFAWEIQQKINESTKLSDLISKKFFNNEELVCGANSSIYSAILLHLARINDNPYPDNKLQICLVAGMIIDPESAPTGIGHAWVMYNGKFLDPSMTLPNEKLKGFPLNSAANYLPVGAYFIIVEPKESRLLNEGHVVFWKPKEN